MARGKNFQEKLALEEYPNQAHGVSGSVLVGELAKIKAVLIHGSSMKARIAQPTKTTAQRTIKYVATALISSVSKIVRCELERLLTRRDPALRQ